MKMKWVVFALFLAASVAFGQASATETPATKKGKAKPASASSASSHSTGAVQASKKTAKKSVKASPMAPKIPVTAKAAKPKAVKKPRVVAAPKKKEEAAAAASTAVAAPGRKRDPFVSPVLARLEGMTRACSGGPRCLAVNEIILRGVVKAPNGMIAIVENAAQRPYFLHENDPIYNGFVEKITPDSVIFKEHFLDNLGHDSQREVVKTVNAPVV